MGNFNVFDNPLVITVNVVMVLGILLALCAIPFMKKETRKLHEKNLARSRLLNEEGF